MGAAAAETPTAINPIAKDLKNWCIGVVNPYFVPRLLSRKTILGGLVVAAVVLAVGIAILLLPAVQKRLLRHALASAGATQIELGYFHVTPFGLRTEGIAFSRGPLQVRTGKVQATVRPGGLFHGRLELTRVSADTLSVSWDLDAPAIIEDGNRGRRPPAPDNYSGIFRKISGPLPLSIEELDLAGRVTIRRGAATFAEAAWTMHGPKLEGTAAIGEELKAKFSAIISPPDRSVQSHVELFGGPSFGMGLPSVQPLLAAWGPISAVMDAEFRVAGDAGVVTRATAGVNVGTTGARAALALAGPWTVGAPLPTPLATLRLEHLPIGWVNPWLATTGLHFEPAELSAAWKVQLSGETVSFTPAEPLTVSGLRLSGPKLPDMGAWRLEASPQIEISRTRAHLTLAAFRLGDATGRRLDLTGDAAADWSGARTVAVNALEVLARAQAAGPPILSLKLLQPLNVDLANPRAAFERAAPGDWLKIAARDAPLDWISRWLPRRTLTGRLAEGESVLSAVAGQGFILATPTPWRMTEVRFDEGGREFFHGALQFSPTGAYGPANQWIRLDQISADDVRGYRVKGRVGAGLRSSDSRMGGGISLEAELPHIPGLGPGSSPLHASLSALAHAFPGGKSEVSRLALTLTGSQGAKLFAVTADRPILIQRTEDSEWLVSSPQPLRFITGELPLSWLNPLLAPKKFALGGVIPATELQLLFFPRRIELDSKAPLAVAHFHLEREGRVVIDRALLRFGLAIKLGIEHHLLPVFRFTSTANFQLRDGVIAAEGSRIAQFEGQVGVSATERSGALNDLSGSLRLDLGALGRMPSLAHARLPAKGIMTLAVKKMPDKAHTVQFDGRIDQVVGRNGVAAPALVLAGRARSDLGQRVGGFMVQATLLTTPRPSDLRFGMKVDYQQLAIFDLSSKLEGAYVDLDGVQQFANAFAPAAPVAARSAPAVPVAAVAAKPGHAAAAKAMLAKAGVSVGSADDPPWGPVRGHFILAIKTIALKPYTLENIGGRLDLAADSITLSGLSGEIFDGKCAADVSAKFQVGGATGLEGFDAHFRLIQVDAGHAVRMKFTNPAAGVDGRLDLDVTISSRAQRWEDLMTNASGKFTLTGHGGKVRLLVPNGDTAATALIAGGTLTFSSELRALGRLIRFLANVPITQLEASGILAADGRLQVKEMRLESPQLRLVATGGVADAKSRDLMGQPMAVQATLAARGDLAVILNGMDLVGPAGPDGYRQMHQPFVISGNVGQPDLKALYDLFAKAVDGSHGTWGILMRKIQAAVAKRRAVGS